MSWLDDIKNAVSGGISYVGSVFKGFGGGGGGVFTDEGTTSKSSGTTKTSKSSSGSSGGSGGSSSSGGSGESTDATAESTDNTTENVKRNDPEKNKQLAEIREMEELRDTLSFEITLPRILKGLHTNQFLFLEVTDTFYEKNYPHIATIVGNKKFGRYAGFERGRFFVEKVVESGGTNGTKSVITLNPLAPSYGQYIKMQQEAEKALIQALNDDSKYEGTDVLSGLGGSISSATLDEIYGIAATFKYGGAGTGLSPEKAWQHYQKGGRNFDCYDCSNWLFYCLREKKIPCRIVQGYSPASKSNTHRVVQIYENGTWHCPKQAWSLTSNLRPFTPEDRYPLKTMLEYTG